MDASVGSYVQTIKAQFLLNYSPALPRDLDFSESAPKAACDWATRKTDEYKRLQEYSGKQRGFSIPFLELHHHRPSATSSGMPVLSVSRRRNSEESIRVVRLRQLIAPNSAVGPAGH